MASYQSSNTNISVTYEDACNIHESGTPISHFVGEILHWNKHLNKGEIIVWDINQDHLWFLYESDGGYITSLGIDILALILIPTAEARLIYLNQ